MHHTENESLPKEFMATQKFRPQCKNSDCPCKYKIDKAKMEIRGYIGGNISDSKVNIDTRRLGSLFKAQRIKNNNILGWFGL